MRRLAPNVLSLFLFFGCAAEATAQRERPRLQQVTVIPPPAAERPAVSVERDAEDGSTTIKLETLTVEENKAAKSRLMLSAHTRREAAAQGSAAAPPQFVHLTLLSRAPRCRFPAQADVQLVLDGANVVLKFQPDSSTTATTATLEVVTVFVPKAEGVLWVQSGTEEGGVCAESLAATLSPQTFARLSAARNAALKIGTANFPLNTQTLTALRELGGRMKQ